MLHLSKSVDEPELMYFPEKGVLSILVHNILLLVYQEAQDPMHVPVRLQLQDVCLSSCILYQPVQNEIRFHCLRIDELSLLFKFKLSEEPELSLPFELPEHASKPSLYACINASLWKPGPFSGWLMYLTDGSEI